MLVIWCLWPLLAICASDTSDTFRKRAEDIMRTTPVIDG
ncbi:Dipeptidase 1 [Apodemus speciosus]|uniref:Dipeptidase 1 n=1 Tax=Apodemus speciosus TaxID=105296 RepID=A0ABQ0F3B3_APOSI